MKLLQVESMYCKELENRIEELSLARELPKDVLEHISICDSCNDCLESARVIGALLSNEQRVAAPEFLKTRVFAFIREIREEEKVTSMSSMWKYLCGAAAAACLVLAMTSFSGSDSEKKNSVSVQSYSGQSSSTSDTSSNPFISEIIGE